MNFLNSNNLRGYVVFVNVKYHETVLYTLTHSHDGNISDIVFCYILVFMFMSLNNKSDFARIIDYLFYFFGIIDRIPLIFIVTYRFMNSNDTFSVRRIQCFTQKF